MLDAALLILRFVTGSVFLAHGWPKAFGSPERLHGRGRTENLFRSRGFPAPALLAISLGYVEVAAGAMTLAGLFTRYAAVILAIVVAGAIPLVKWKQGFVDGWDWPVTLVAICICIALLGAGEISLDAILGIS